MPFSAVTCLTYTGTTTLGGNMNFYSNIDGYSTPFQTGINISAITTNQCPYYISNVPDGTTTIRIYDTFTGCYCDLPIQSNDLCVTCNLNFTNYSASTVGRLVAGNLTGTCNPNITDYRIYWYETGDTMTPAYVSGFGTAYTPYNFTHPLTGSTAIFAQAGTYIPIIDKIKLSGLTFSQTGGTGNIPAELECFTSTTVTVDAFTCSNGNSSNDPRYQHRVNFLSASNGAPPISLDSTFLLTGITNYFAWRFCGFDVPDRLRLFYSGSAYQNELLLEDITCGKDVLNTNFNLNLISKSASTWNTNDYIKKVTCLTGLTRNPGDVIRLEVTPNPQNPQTNWDYYFTCLDTMETNPCILSFPSYKIIFSSLTYSVTSCSRSQLTLALSGCQTQDNFNKYVLADSSNFTIRNTNYTNQDYGMHSRIFSFVTDGSQSSTYLLFGSQSKSCATPSTNTITYKKYVSGGTGVIDMEFDNINDFNTYYLNYLNIHNTTSGTYGQPCTSASGPFSGTPYDNTNIKYYRYYELRIPTSTGNATCGDGIGQILFQIHPSTTVTTGFTTPNYTLRFTMPTTNLGLFLTGCSVSGITETSRSIVNSINLSSTGTSNNYTGTTLTGSKYTSPFAVISLCVQTGLTTNLRCSNDTIISVPNYLNDTIVYSGNPYTIVPSLTAQTFNFNTPDFIFFSSSNNLGYFYRKLYQYCVELTNPTIDVRDFSMSARTQSIGGATGPYTLIYSYTGTSSAGTIHNPTYFV